MGGQALFKKKEELTKKRILAEHLTKMKLKVEARERIRSINDQKKRILTLLIFLLESRPDRVWTPSLVGRSYERRRSAAKPNLTGKRRKFQTICANCEKFLSLMLDNMYCTDGH